MAIMDVLPANFWHLSLKGTRKEIIKDLEKFPPLTITSDTGILTRKIRGYHSGAPINIHGDRIIGRCFEAEFPNALNTPSFESYLPVKSIMFWFDGKLYTEQEALKLYEDLEQETCGTSELVPIQRYHQIIEEFTGERFRGLTPCDYGVKGIVRSANVPRIIEIREDLIKRFGSKSCSDLKFSLDEHSDGLEKTLEF